MMMLRHMIPIGVLLCAAPARAAEDQPSEVVQQYQKLLQQYEAEGGTRIFAPRFLSLARENPEDPAPGCSGFARYWLEILPPHLGYLVQIRPFMMRSDPI